MVLFHTTPLRNWASIKQWGLLLSYSRQAMAANWLHTREKTAWAHNHVRMKHTDGSEPIVTISVRVPRKGLRKHADGLYYIKEDISPTSFRYARVYRVKSGRLKLR